MKTLKSNWFKMMYLVLLMTLWAMIPHTVNAQAEIFYDNNINVLVGTSDSRMVLSIHETDTSVVVRVMMVGPVGIWTDEVSITYNETALTLMDPTYTHTLPVGTAVPLYPCMDLSQKCQQIYANGLSGVSQWYPIFEQLTNLQPGAIHGKFFKSMIISNYAGTPKPSECIIRPQGELFPMYNIYFKKNTSNPLQTADLGFFTDDFFGIFNGWSAWGEAAMMITNFPIPVSGGSGTGSDSLRPNMFVYRFPSEVLTDPVTNIAKTTATLNANYWRGDFGPASDMYMSRHNSSTATGRRNWDTISHYGFLYAETNAAISINDVSDMITINGTEYAFPNSTTIASSGAAGITIGPVTFKMVEFVNGSIDQGVNYDSVVTGLDTYTKEYFVWSYIRYAFETSNAYLQVHGPVRFTKLINCEKLGDVKFVSENCSGDYTHGFDKSCADKPGIDTTWDAKSFKLVTNLDSVKFIAKDNAGIVVGTGTSLDGFTFAQDTTYVTWIAWQNELTDTCEFMVIITDKFLECDSTPDQNVVVNNGDVYIHSGFSWDVKVRDGFVLTDSMFVLLDNTNGATVHPTPPDTLRTLNNYTFEIGTTFVKWYGFIDTLPDGTQVGLMDSCEFKVVVNPTDFLDCSAGEAHYYVQEPAINSGYTNSDPVWDIQPVSIPHFAHDPVYSSPTDSIPVTLDSLFYRTTGALGVTQGTTLIGVNFPKGTTTVTWYGYIDGSVATCTFDVTVYPKKFLSCPSVYVKIVNEEGATGYYTKYDDSWDINPVAGPPTITLSSAYYTAPGATPDNSSTLQGTKFPLGTTKIKFYGVITNPNGPNFRDSCDLEVRVRPSYIMECDSMPDQFVQEDAAGLGYTHSGSSWDAVARLGITFSDSTASIQYPTGPAVPATTLNGKTFPVGVTHVKWVATHALGKKDTCEFDVTVYPKHFLACKSWTDTVVKENSPANYYTHDTLLGSWDIQPQTIAGLPTIVLQSKTYYATPAAGTVTPSNGSTLHNVRFPMGVVTHVEWVGVIHNPNGADFTDTCRFDVLVVPSSLLICGADKNVMENNSGYYKHSGTPNWNATLRATLPSIPPIPLVGSINYSASTVTPIIQQTGTDITGAEFAYPGPHIVKWYAHAEYTRANGAKEQVYDSCSYNVTVRSMSLLYCTAMGNKQLNETAPMHGYDHTGNSWDAVLDPQAIASGLSITTNYRVTTPTGSTIFGGSSLNGFNFPVGVSTVTWFAQETGGHVDSCKFTVTIDALPIAVLDCSGLSDIVVGSDVAGSAIYTHLGTSWDALPGDPAMTILTALNYRLDGATTGTGAWTLDGVVFKLGKTTVTWTGQDQYGFIDSCKFVVTVIMTCPANITYQGIIYNVTPLAGLCWTDNMANKNYDDVVGTPIEFAKPYTCPTCPAQLDTIFGLLYTWYSAVNVPEGSTALPVPNANGHVMGICQSGTHIPSQAELNLLNLYSLDDLKSTQYWMVPGTNATGFNALPAGKYNGAVDRFEDLYGYTAWWTSVSSTDLTTLYNFITYYCDGITTQELLKSDGLSVRCILDY